MIRFGQGRPTTREANDENPAKGRDTAHGFVKDVTTHRIIDDIRPTAMGQLSHLLPKAVRVIDHMVRPHLLTHGESFCRAGGGNHSGAKQLTDVDCSQSDPASGTVRQQHFPGFEATALQCIIGRMVAGPEGCRRLKAHRGRQRRDTLGLDYRLLSKPPWHQHTVPRFDVLHSRTSLKHHTGCLTAWNKRQVALDLILPGNHQHIDITHPASPQRDLNFAWPRCRGSEVTQYQIIRAPQLFAEDRLHVTLLCLFLTRHDASLNLWCHRAFGRNIAHDGGRHEGATAGINKHFTFVQTAITITTLKEKVVGGHTIGRGVVERFPADLYVEHTTAGWFPRVIRQSYA